MCAPHVYEALGEGVVIARYDGDGQLIGEIEGAPPPPPPPRDGIDDPGLHAHPLLRGTRVTAVVVLGGAEDLDPAAGRRQTGTSQGIPIGHPVHFRDSAPEINLVEPGVESDDGDSRCLAVL